MNLLKYQRGYLGDQDDVLDSRITARCTDQEELLQVSAAVTLVDSEGAARTNVIEPKVTKLTDTVALVVYRNINATEMWANLIVTNKLTATVSGEVSIATGTSITTSAVTRIEDNKVLVTFMEGTNLKGIILNVSGTTITPATEYTLVSGTMAGNLYTAPPRTHLLDTNKCVCSYRNSDAGKLSLVVLSINPATHEVTAGTPALWSGNTNMFYNNFAVIDSTTLTAVGFSGTRVVAVGATISGTTVTFGGSSYLFPTTTQITPPTSYSAAQVHITPGVVTNTSEVTAIITTSNPSFTAICAHWSVLNSSGVITSANILQQTTETASSIMSFNGPAEDQHTLIRKADSSSLRLLQNNIRPDPPTSIQTKELVGSADTAHPEGIYLSAGVSCAVFEEFSGSNVLATVLYRTPT